MNPKPRNLKMKNRNRTSFGVSMRDFKLSDRCLNLLAVNMVVIEKTES